MLLKVGDLARRTGLTVRTLHHYDEIGLLKPSGRSEAGYRLYSQADVQRLHGIQTMRQMGLALSDIGALLAGDGMAPERIIGQQIRSLDQQIAQATELRGRLTMLRDGLMAGAEPDMGNWLEALALMTTYGKYFSSAELKHIFQNWNLIEADWLIVKDHGAQRHGPPTGTRHTRGAGAGLPLDGAHAALDEGRSGPAGALGPYVPHRTQHPGAQPCTAG